MQFEAVYQGLAVVALLAAEEIGRAGQEELVEQAFANQLSYQRRAALAENDAGRKRRQHARKVHRVLHQQLRASLAEPCLTASSGDDQCVLLQGRVRQIEIAAGADDGEQRARRESELPPQLAECARLLWVDALRVPESFALAKRPCDDQDRAGAGAQKAHDE